MTQALRRKMMARRRRNGHEKKNLYDTGSCVRGPRGRDSDSCSVGRQKGTVDHISGRRLDLHGDVTDTLRIVSVSKSDDGTSASLVYAAKDDAGNVTTKTRVMPVAGAAEPANTQSAAASAEPAASAADSAASTAAQPEQETASASSGEAAESTASESAATPTPDPETQAEQADEAVRNTLAADAPRLYLKVHYVTLSVGEKFSYMSYISQLTDDKDSSATLSQRINVGGAASSGKLDTSTPGNYDVEYSCDDSDGNKSNVAILHVTVQ